MWFYFTAKQRYLIKIFVATLLSSATPVFAQGWELIGRGAFADDTETFLRRDALEDVGEGQFYVTTLTVHPVTVRGIDLPTSNGETYYDTNYPHRSYIQISIYDCRRRMIAVGQTLYFSGSRPEEDELVYKHVEDEPMLFPEIFVDPVFNAVC